MEFLIEIKKEIPEWAKDIRLNLDSLLARPSKLSQPDALGVALAAAFAAKSPFLIEQFKSGLLASDATAALTAAALMGMNNAWYPYGEMTGDEQLQKQPTNLRMNAYANYGGIEKKRFELFALAASIIGKCHFCVKSHYKTLKDEGVTTDQLHEAGRIAAVVNATAQVLVAQGK
jgi:alkyl hydroperoxide reductase subunit D